MKKLFYPLYLLLGIPIVCFILILTDIKHDTVIGAIVFLSMALAFLTEKTIPHSENLEQKNAWRDIVYTIINLVFLMLVGPLTIYGFALLFGFLLNTPTLFTSEQLGPIYLQTIVCFLGIDLIRYWIHRAQHKYSWLWKFHSAHHSIKTVYSGNNFYSHPLDLFLRHGVPAYIASAIGFHSMALGMSLGTLALIGIFSHCNAAFDLGFLNKFITTNEVHRWHHHEEFEDGAKNYAPSLCLWDQIFKTYYFIKKTH